MIRKNSKKDNVEISIKIPFGKNRKFAKIAFNVNQLDEQILVAKISTQHKKVTANPEPNMKKIGINFTQFSYQFIKFCISRVWQ